MALMDKFLSYMRLNDEENDEFYDEEDEYFDEDDDFEEKAPVKKSFGKTFQEEIDTPAPQPSKVTPMRTQVTPRRSSSTNGMEVCVIKPVSIEDAKEITDTLRAGRAVVLNLEGLDVEIAQRIIDFASGSSYAIDGKLQKISHYIFIITPKTVEISGDFPESLTSAFDAPGVPSIKNPLR